MKCKERLLESLRKQKDSRILRGQRAIGHPAGPGGDTLGMRVGTGEMGPQGTVSEVAPDKVTKT